MHASPPDLRFRVEGAEVLRYAATPTLAFRVSIETPDAREIRSIALQTQVRIVPARRPYVLEEEEGLLDLFGPRRRWGETVKSFVWAQAGTVVPPFVGRTGVDLPVVCTYDFDVTSAKYFHALRGGDVPLEFLFRGTCFYAEPAGLRAAQVPWNAEAAFAFPVAVWKEMMEAYFPNSAWLRVRQDVFDRLARYKVRHTLPTWDATLERLLARAEDGA